jgi:hypothetical protein
MGRTRIKYEGEKVFIKDFGGKYRRKETTIKN